MQFCRPHPHQEHVNERLRLFAKHKILNYSIVSLAPEIVTHKRYLSSYERDNMHYNAAVYVRQMRVGEPFKVTGTQRVLCSVAKFATSPFNISRIV